MCLFSTIRALAILMPDSGNSKSKKQSKIRTTFPLCAWNCFFRHSPPRRSRCKARGRGRGRHPPCNQKSSIFDHGSIASRLLDIIRYPSVFLAQSQSHSCLFILRAEAVARGWQTCEFDTQISPSQMPVVTISAR